MDRRLDCTISGLLVRLDTFLGDRQIAGGGGGRSSCGCVKRTEPVETVETGMASTYTKVAPLLAPQTPIAQR